MALIGNIGPWQIVLIIILVVLLFGRGKISQLMGDVAKGINSFKRGMKEGETEDAAQRAINEGGPTVEARTESTTSAAGSTPSSEPSRNG